MSMTEEVSINNYFVACSVVMGLLLLGEVFKALVCYFYAKVLEKQGQGVKTSKKASYKDQSKYMSI